MMERIFKASLVSAMFFGMNLSYGATVTSAATAAVPSTSASTSTAGKSAANKPWLKCAYMPNSGSTSALNAVNYGFVFGLEPYNNNVLSVDTYELNAQGKRIKQVGHAEAISSNTGSGNSSSALAIQSTQDSPATFSFSASVVVKTAGAGAQFNGTLGSTTLLSGLTIAGLPLQCKLASSATVSNP